MHTYIDKCIPAIPTPHSSCVWLHQLPATLRLICVFVCDCNVYKYIYSEVYNGSNCTALTHIYPHEIHASPRCVLCRPIEHLIHTIQNMQYDCLTHIQSHATNAQNQCNVFLPFFSFFYKLNTIHSGWNLCKIIFGGIGFGFLDRFSFHWFSLLFCICVFVGRAMEFGQQSGQVRNHSGNKTCGEIKFHEIITQ